MSTTEAQKTSGWVRMASFGAAILVIVGLFNVIQGVAAIVGPDTYFVAVAGQLLLFDVAGWGWWNIIVGAALVFVGLLVARGVTWARIVAVVLVGINALGQLILVPAQPWWSLIVIALDVVIIYALLAHGRELHD
jgi:hypothetical protein